MTKEKIAEKTKKDFVSMVSHELRTPLTSIRGSLGLIISGVLGDIPEKVSQLLNIASNNSIRLVNLINDILDLEKIRAGKMTFNFDEYEVMSLVEESILFNNEYAKGYNVKIEICERLDGAKLNVDKDKFIQVMTNLLSNASKFSLSNEIIEVRVKRNKHLVLVEVANFGVGISQENQAHTFEDFYQEDSTESRKRGGTGLGLSICRQIIKNMGGDINFNSKLDDKTTFYFQLPEIISSGIKKVALIVEDNKTTATCLQVMLNELSFMSDIALCAEEARSLLATKKYDIMTLDLILPDANGFDLLNEIKKTESTKDLPVIIISATDKNKMNTEKIDKNEIVEWLDKSFDIEALQKTIAKIIQEKNKDKINILHIEDDEDILKITKSSLEAVANVSSAKTLEHAQAMITSHFYDLIILDYKLPDGNCDELIYLIKKSQSKDAKLIVFSAYEVSDFLASQVDAVIQKTKVSNEQFCECIEKFINKKSNI